MNRTVLNEGLTSFGHPDQTGGWTFFENRIGFEWLRAGRREVGRSFGASRKTSEGAEADRARSEEPGGLNK
jgi:hypothetical protein